jgi:hypothetical protein
METVVVAALTAAVTAGAPAVAETIADFARNADKVDGKHAVGAAASIEQRKGKLVATNGQTGRLPNNIIRKAPDADRLDGRDSTGFVAVGTPAAGDLVGTYPAPEIGAGAVGSAEIGPDAVGNEEIAADTVGSPELANDSVTRFEVAADQVRSSELGIINLRTASKLVPGNTPRNGNYQSETASVFCGEGEIALSGSAHWSGGEDEGELHIVIEAYCLSP